MTRELRLIGHIDDPPFYHMGADYSAPHFHGKSVFLTINSPDTEWLNEVRTKQNAKCACGYVWVNARVEPETYELNGETRDVQPVQIHLVTMAEAFDAICRQVAEGHGPTIGMTILLGGDQLPDLDEGKTILLKDLNVSVGRQYAVESFEISCAIGNQHPDGNS